MKCISCDLFSSIHLGYKDLADIILSFSLKEKKLCRVQSHFEYTVMLTHCHYWSLQIVSKINIFQVAVVGGHVGGTCVIQYSTQFSQSQEIIIY